MTAVALPVEPEAKQPEAGLAKRSLGALKWNYLGAAARIGSQFVIGILLARLLGPEPFGLVAIAWLLLGLGNLVADFGLASALIQRATINERDIRYVFTLQLLMGAGLSALVYFSADYLAVFYRRPDAASVLQWMGLCFLFQAAGQTATALLRRSLDHRRVQICQVLSYLAGYLLLGIPLALGGAGVWALVVAQLCQSLLYSCSTYLSVRHPLLPSFRSEQTGMLAFGSKVMASNLTSWGISNLDSAIIGRILGVLDLGLYNRSMNLVAAPMNAAVSSLQGVLFPLYSRLQGQTDQIRRTYLAVICLLSLVLVPMFAAVAAIPETLVLGIYGSSWRAAAVIITPLALAMPVNAILAMSGPLMMGQARAGLEAGAQLLGVLVMVAAVSFFAGYSLSAVAWAVLAVYCLRAVLVTRLALGLIGTPAGAILRALAGSVTLGIIAAVVAWLLDSLLTVPLPVSAVRVFVDLACAGCAALLGMVGFGRWLICREAREILGSATSHLPQWLQAIVARWSVV